MFPLRRPGGKGSLRQKPGKFRPPPPTSRRVGARTAAFSWTAATPGRVQPQDRRGPVSIGCGLQRSSLGQLGHPVPWSRRCRPPTSACCTRPPGRSRPEGLQVRKAVRSPRARRSSAAPPDNVPRLAFQPKFCVRVRPPKASTLTPLQRAGGEHPVAALWGAVPTSCSALRFPGFSVPRVRSMKGVASS